LKSLETNQGEIKNTLIVMVLAFIFCLGMWQLGITQQNNFQYIMLYAGVAFGCYLLLLRFNKSLWIFLWIGFIARFILVFLFPTLSDDIYRFVWDGKLIANGMNPYSYLPIDIVKENMDGLSEELYSNLNSPEYFTIYPPISQLIFWFSSAWTDNISHSSIVMKSIFLIAEIMTIKGIILLLQKLGKPIIWACFYWLNPLIIIEGVGNLHFEIITISFLVWSLYFIFCKTKLFTGAILLACSVATKLLPLIFLPYLFFRLASKERWKFFSSFTIVSFILFIPIILGVQLLNFGLSVDLYFQKFEFNASVYYILRYFGKLLTGYNLIHYIGPLLGIASLIIILRKAISIKNNSLIDFLNFGLFAFCTYLFLATTIHPWYLCIPILLASLTGHRFVLVWSFLIMLTYINYSYIPYYENLWIVGVEYFLVALLVLFESKITLGKS